MVTDHIETFTEKGHQLRSGAELEADLIVTATGLNLVVLGDLRVHCRRPRVDFSRTMNYKGMMFSDVPNLASCFGYTNASWTLKCDLTCDMSVDCSITWKRRATAVHAADATLRSPRSRSLAFSSGYLLRSMAKFPKQGSRRPWRLHQNYALDIVSCASARSITG